MKLFNLLQTNLATLGICSNQSPYNAKLLMSFLIYAINIPLYGMFFLYEAKTFLDYINAIYVESASIFFAICLTNIVFKKTELFNFLLNFHKIVNKSKWTLNISIGFALIAVQLFIKFQKKILRIKKSSICNDIRQNKSTSGKNQQNHLFCYRKSDTHKFDCTKVHCMPYHLLYNWFGKWIFWIAIPNVVSLQFTSS